jgi:large subunit ribosomal protein L23
MAIFDKKTESEETTEKKTETPAVKGFAGSRTVLIQPRISEKSSRLSNIGKYVFKVAVSANKIDVKKAIESLYKVKVVQVNMVNVKGKNRNFANRAGVTSKFKKAVVSLKEGDKIDVEVAA